MAEEVQNVRIKFTTDTAGLKEANKEFEQLSDSEKDAVNAFNKFNAEAKKQEGILEKLQREEKLLLQSRLKSNDPKAIATFNKQLESTRSQIRNLTSETKQSANAMSSAFASVGTSIAAAFSIGAAVNFAKQAIEVTSQFQKLEAVLTNTLGSKSAAQSALALIKDFAATTNFSVLELTEGFVKLANSGFVPTKDELENLADVANSTGKSFDMLVEAILDANTFQFERLKEFGIKASQEGDKIKFTFKGVTTEVQKSSGAVQKYLIGLGDLQGVSGSTAAISKTLGGQISNLGDAYDSLLLSIGTNANDGVSGGITILNAGLVELTKSTQGYESVFTPLFNIVRAAIDPFTRLASSVMDLFTGVANAEDAGSGIKTFFTIIEKGAKIATLPIKILINGITTLIDGVNLLKNVVKGDFSFADLNKLKSDANKFIEIITLTDGQVESKQEESAAKEEESNKKKEEAITAETKKQRDKRFKDALDDLKRREDLARRENKVEGGGTPEDLQIQEGFQNQRLELIRSFLGKSNITYEEASLHLREIEKEETDFVIDEAKKRADELEKLNKERVTDSLKVLDETQKARLISNNEGENAEIEASRQAFTRREITFKEYQEKESQIKFQNARKDLEDQITIDQEKLLIENLSAEQRLQIEKDLQDKEKQLRDLDFDQYSKNEEEKTKKSEEEAAKRRQLLNQIYETGVSVINSLAEINANANEKQLLDLKAKQEHELALVGDNKEAQDRINKKFAEKERQLKEKQARADKNIALFNAVVNTAAAIVKTLASVPYPANIPLALLVGAAGAAQVAAITSRPIPKFYKGTEYVDLNGAPKGRDTVHAMLHEGERVVPDHINKKLSGIPNSDLPWLADIYRNKIDYAGIQKSVMTGESGGSTSTELIKEFRSMNKKIDKLQKIEITIDNKGIKKLIRTEYSETQFVNDNFRV